MKKEVLIPLSSLIKIVSSQNMKKYFFYTLLVLVALEMTSQDNKTISQSFSGEEIIEEKGLEVRVNYVNEFVQLVQVGEFSKTILDNSKEPNNIAIISQIGNGNSISASNFEGSSQLFYEQSGNLNSIVNINNLNVDVSQHIIQQGNKNGVLAISSGNLDLIQQGDGIKFEQIGTNPFTNNIRIKMTGNARTVSVRSINVTSNTTSN